MIKTRCLLRTAMLASVLVAMPVAYAEEITFEDQRGKTVTLTEPVDSIVILPKPIPFMYVAVDGGPQDLKGIHPATKKVMLDSIIGQIYPALANVNTSVVTTGFIPNAEELLKIAPDVVMQWSGDDAHLIEPMERVGIEVVALGWGSREIEKQHLQIVGRLSGNDNRVAAFLDWQTNARAALDKGLASIPPEKRTTMVYIDTLANNEITIFPAAQFFFTAPGLRNLAYEAGVPGSTAEDHRRDAARLGSGHHCDEPLRCKAEAELTFTTTQSLVRSKPCRTSAFSRCRDSTRARRRRRSSGNGWRASVIRKCSISTFAPRFLDTMPAPTAPI